MRSRHGPGRRAGPGRPREPAPLWRFWMAWLHALGSAGHSARGCDLGRRRPSGARCRCAVGWCRSWYGGQLRGGSTNHTARAARGQSSPCPRPRLKKTGQFVPVARHRLRTSARESLARRHHVQTKVTADAATTRVRGAASHSQPEGEPSISTLRPSRRACCLQSLPRVLRLQHLRRRQSRWRRRMHSDGHRILR